MQEDDKIIECRVYQTVHGPWYYFTANDGQINLEKGNYILITTLEGYRKLETFFGIDQVVPIYIEVDDFDRIERALKREKEQNTQNTGEDFKFTLMSSLEEEGLQARLSLMMEDITMQGKKLGKHMDVRDMRQYRKLIQEFMNEIVNRSHKFSRENFLDRRGRHRVYGMIKRVNVALDELAGELIKEEKDHLGILAKIDEIRGMLLDILT